MRTRQAGLLALALLVLSVEPGRAAQDAARRDPARAEIDAVARKAGELLASYDARDRAWGAYLAGRFDLVECVPAISAALDAAAGADGDAESVRSATLDALVRLRADVDPALLARVFRSDPDTTTVLLCRRSNDAAAQRTMLDLLGRTRETTWFAFTNALTSAKAPGFAARTLADLRISVDVMVTDGSGGGVGPNGNMACGDGFFTAPAGFPPVTLYSVTLYPTGFVVSAGEQTVYCATQTVEPGATTGVGDCSSRIDVDEYRIGCLAKMLGVSRSDVGLRTDVATAVTWEGASSYEEDVRETLARVDREIAAAKARLVDAGLLTKAESEASAPSITVDVHDRRHSKRPRLPKLEGVDYADE